MAPREVLTSTPPGAATELFSPGPSTSALGLGLRLCLCFQAPPPSGQGPPQVSWFTKDGVKGKRIRRRPEEGARGCQGRSGWSREGMVGLGEDRLGGGSACSAPSPHCLERLPCCLPRCPLSGAEGTSFTLFPSPSLPPLPPPSLSSGSSCRLPRRPWCHLLPAGLSVSSVSTSTGPAAASESKGKGAVGTLSCAPQPHRSPDCRGRR